jgi:hypothetical protein
MIIWALASTKGWAFDCDRTRHRTALFCASNILTTAPPSSPVAPTTRISFPLPTGFLPKGFLINDPLIQFNSSGLKSLSSIVKIYQFCGCCVSKLLIVENHFPTRKENNPDGLSKSGSTLKV